MFTLVEGAGLAPGHTTWSGGAFIFLRGASDHNEISLWDHRGRGGDDRLEIITGAKSIKTKTFFCLSVFFF